MALEQVNRRVRALGLAAVVALGVGMGSPAAAAAAVDESTGIVLLAHGGSEAWNNLVTTLAKQVAEHAPTEVAFGMADRAAIQSAVDKLVERGVMRIVAVPLFVSSHSSVFESSQYLLGARDQAPADLAMFASMHHHHGGGAATAAMKDNASHADGTQPVTSPVPIQMTRAFDRDPIVAQILTSRAQALSRNPAGEVVVLVAHGPGGDEENAQWVDDMQVVAAAMAAAVPFARVDALTVRDDAEKTVRQAAAEDLRNVVSKALADGHRALIVPLVLAYGGIEDGIRERLKGLTFDMAEQGLLPDERLLAWVLEAAQVASGK